MELARVVGTLWATQQHASFRGGRLLVIQPIDAERRPAGATLIAHGHGRRRARRDRLLHDFLRGHDPVAPADSGIDLTPVGASIVGIVDRIDRAPPSRPGAAAR